MVMRLRNEQEEREQMFKEAVSTSSSSFKGLVEAIHNMVWPKHDI
jgi:predicted sulfurtransferase